MNYLKLDRVLLLFVFVSLLSCAPSGNIAVYNAGSAGTSQEGRFVYALPQTVFDITVTAEATTIIPGPYEKYAEKYLGIQNAPAKTEKTYALRKVFIHQHMEADPDYIYTISGTFDEETLPGLKKLLDDSLILRAPDFSANRVNHYTYLPESFDLLYTDLSVKRNFEAEKDVEISLVMPDTLYASRTVSRNTLKEKTLEQKAEEAANFLIKLKKRRFKLVAGQYDYMPEGEAMGEALKELTRIEEEYLSLFIGKRVITEITRDFRFVPDPVKENDRQVIFRFSTREGIVDSREISGIPVVLELNAMQLTRDLEAYKMPVKPALDIIPYRIAEEVSVKIMAGEQVWVDGILPVFQSGAFVPLRLWNR